MDPVVVVLIIKEVQECFQFRQVPENLVPNGFCENAVKAFNVAVFLRGVGMRKHLIQIILLKKLADYLGGKLGALSLRISIWIFFRSRSAGCK